jgi:hypothetical protein
MLSHGMYTYAHILIIALIVPQLGERSDTVDLICIETT